MESYLDMAGKLKACTPASARADETRRISVADQQANKPRQFIHIKPVSGLYTTWGILIDTFILHSLTHSFIPSRCRCFQLSTHRNSL